MPNPVLSQSVTLELQWSQTYDNYHYASMIQTVDGGFLIAGVPDSLQGLLFVKTSCGGEVEWSKTFSTINGAPKLMRSMDFGYYCLLPGGYAGARVLKMDLQGNFEWVKQYDFGSSAAFDREVSDLCVANDGSFVLVVSESGARSPWQVSLFKGYDVDGVLLWEKSVEDVMVRVVLSFEDGGGGYFVAGWRDKRLWFAKLDSSCEVIWSRTYRSLFSRDLSGVRSIIPTSDGGFLLVGYLPLDSRDGVDFVVKVDGKGKELWSQKYDSRVHDMVEVGSGGQFLMFNRSEVVCVGASGKKLWVEPYSEYLEDSVSLVNVTYLSRDVSAFVGEDGSVVVAVPYGVAVGGYTSDLWVASF
ncbi:MAG: hypothetical protein LBH62_06460, partial [Nitrososphaerota archaeon]|nr:hypothetical protein [Nitrososphaerota archaeon]